MEPDTLRALASKFDLKAYIETKFSGVRIERYGKEIAVPCPVCDGQQARKPHLYINIEKRKAICYRCADTAGTGSYGDVIELVAMLENVSYTKALRLVHAQCTLTRADLRTAIKRLQEEAAAEEPMRKILLPEGFQTAYDRHIPPVFEEFYRKRGLSEDTRRRYGMGFTLIGQHAYRSIVPITMDGTRWTWVGRDVTGRAEKKVLYPKGSKTGRLLFNLDVARHYSTIILVEGVYDAIRVGSQGVAILGTNLSSHQIAKLVETKARTVVLMLDPDARAKAQKLAATLADFFPTVKVVNLDADPDEYERKALLLLAAKAKASTARERLAARVSRLQHRQ